LRADPPRLTPEELVDVLTTADSASIVPLVRCLSVADNDIRHVFMQGLKDLRRDGLLPIERLFDRLTSAELAPEGWTALLSSLSPDGIKALLDVATMATVDGHLPRERCRDLFLGSDPLRPAAERPALALFRMACDTGNPQRMGRYLDAVKVAVSRGVLLRDELVPLLGLGQDEPSAALASVLIPPADKRMWIQHALYVWNSRIVSLCLGEQLSVAEAAALLTPERLSDEHRWRALGDPWRLSMAQTTLGAISPLTVVLGATEQPVEPAEVTQRRRQLLNTLVGADGGTPCLMLRQLGESSGATEQDRFANQLRSTMKRLRFSAAEVARTTGLA
jgi:hypothetical protein